MKVDYDPDLKRMIFFKEAEDVPAYALAQLVGAPIAPSTAVEAQSGERRTREDEKKAVSVSQLQSNRSTTSRRRHDKSARYALPEPQLIADSFLRYNSRSASTGGEAATPG